MNGRLKIVVLIGCLFLISVSNAFAQISYEFDFNGDEIFENDWNLINVGDTLNVDIWLDGYECLPSNELFGTQLYFNYDPDVLQVNDAYPNDSDHGGPFTPAVSSFEQEEAGIYFLMAANFDLVTVTDNKIKLGTIQLERIIAGDTQIVAADDNGYIVDCNFANQYPSNANATIYTTSFCKGLADFDQDVDGTDAFMFKQHFGRSLFGNPCPPDGPAPVPKTGQISSWGTGDDGYLEKGVAWPDPRFTDNDNGAVTDNLTGLIWLKNANCFGQRTWHQALLDCNGLSAGWCGLTDGSSAGDWRLPNRFELESLLEMQTPPLPTGHPFTNLESDHYWSSTSDNMIPEYAWYVSMGYGRVDLAGKGNLNYVWPVRGGH